MKLISMHIDNFGGLHDYDYSFEEGLNVVLRDNGWGKTTMAAFLKAMLYGYGTKRSKDISENERKRYLPWQGGKYGGTLDFEAGGVRFRIIRTFGETPRFDTVRIIDLERNVSARIPADKIGETLFHLDANAFKRSVFINQNGMMIDGAASSIHTRLNAIVSSANDLAVYDEAIKKLTEEIKIYEKTGARGLIGDIDRKIAELQRECQSSEASIRAQDIARERVKQIDKQLAQINKQLEEKEKKLEAVSGESKKREAAQKLLEEIDGRISELQNTLDNIKAELGGSIPAHEEINNALQASEKLTHITAQIEFKDNEARKLSNEYSEIAKRYGGSIPSYKQAEEIRTLFSELQGLRKSDTAESSAEAEDVPEEYLTIKAAVDKDPDYIAKAESASALQSEINALRLRLSDQESNIKHEHDLWADIKKRCAALSEETARFTRLLEDSGHDSPNNVEPVMRSLERIKKETSELERRRAKLENDLRHETVSWNDKRKQYLEYTADIEETDREIDSRKRFSRDNTSTAISALRDMQLKQQGADSREQNLSASRLTPDEEKLLHEKEGTIPDAAQIREIQNKYRSETRSKAEAGSLSARAEGEKSKCESLKTALSQLEAAEEAESVSNKKSSAVIMMGAGAALLIVGIILAVTVSPVFAAAALVGAGLAVYGFITQKKDKEKARELEEKAAEVQRKRSELSKDLEKAEEELESISRKITEYEERIRPDEQTVAQWCGTMGIDHESLSEAYFDELIDTSTKVRNLKERKTKLAAEEERIRKDREQIASRWSELTAAFPECADMTMLEASVFLTDAQSEYNTLVNGQKAKKKELERLIKRSGVSEKALLSDVSPNSAAYSKELESIAVRLISLNGERKKLDYVYPEITELGYDEALSLLRSRLGSYKVIEAQRAAALKNEQRLLSETGCTKEALNSDVSPRVEGMLAERENTRIQLEKRIKTISDIFSAIGIRVSDDDPDPAVRRAEAMVNEYRRYESLLIERRKKKESLDNTVEELQLQLSRKLETVCIKADEEDIPKRLEIVVNDINRAAGIKEKIREIQEDRRNLAAEHTDLENLIRSFRITFSGEKGLSEIAEISEKSDLYGKTAAAQEQLAKQRETHIREHGISDEQKTDPKESSLRESVERLKREKEELLIEYTQKSEFIRNADKVLESYPLLRQQIEQAAQRKRKAVSKVAALKRTEHLIDKAKENLANRYLNKVEQLFNNYMQIWLESKAVRGILDIDFNITIEENDKVNEAKGYSTGYCDMIDFCMRLALIDTLFESEQPFIILDDPFVNLDAERLEKAMELLGVLALNKQIIYFVCHPIRALDTNDDSESRKEFVKLAEEARNNIRRQSAAKNAGGRTVAKQPKDMYKLSDRPAQLPIRLVNTNHTITNNIFSLSFDRDETIHVKDKSYELFFIDVKGHVLNDRQLLEISGDGLSASRVHFCLNTRDDSGDMYELMIHEVGQDDYTVAARIPFKAKLTFAGTFDFDF